MPAKILLRKTSLVDYPGRVSSVLFFSGCNLRCPWCHNPELVRGGAKNPAESTLTDQGSAPLTLIGVEDALAHLRKRFSVLGGVVLSGGEPCLQEELPDIIAEIKKIALSSKSAALPVKLDTNGMFPAMLEKLFSRAETRPDYIALDLKIAPERYGELTANNGENQRELGEKLIQSAALIRQSGIEHEYRTLALPGAFITEKDIEALAPLTDSAPWYFRPFRGGNCLDPAWDNLEEPVTQAQGRLKVLAGKAGKRAITGK